MVTLELHLTNQCNLRCLHCYADYSSMNYTFLPLETAIKAMDDFKKMNGFFPERSTIAFSGGEALLHPYETALVDYAAKNFDGLTILTNGILLTKEVIQKFADYGNISIQLSIEGNETIHNAIRGKNHFQEVLARIHLLQEFNIDTQCAMTVNAMNSPFMEFYLQLCTEMDVKSTFHRYIPLGRNLESLRLSPADGSRIYSDLVSLIRKYPVVSHCNLCSMIALTGPSRNHSPCYIGTRCIVIDHHGSLVPCPYLGTPVADVSKSDLSEVFFSSELLNLFRERRYGNICRTCRYSHECGGCRALSYAYTGDMFADEPLCPYVMENTGE
jgi:radical SAM protein with 4Fe4S-binding SPASM domain